MDWLPPEPPPLNRLELLAMKITPELDHLGFNARCEWLRRHLRSEIAKRRAGPGRSTSSTSVSCASCGIVYEIAPRNVNGTNVCKTCRTLNQPDANADWYRAWVETIPNESLDELAGALALLR